MNQGGSTQLIPPDALRPPSTGPFHLLSMFLTPHIHLSNIPTRSALSPPPIIISTTPISLADCQTMQSCALEQNVDPQVDSKGSRRRRHKCPECGRRSLVLLHRRPIDHMISRVVPVRRYGCSDPECRWEGSLPSSKGRERLPMLWKTLLWGPVILVLMGSFLLSMLYLLRD